MARFGYTVQTKQGGLLKGSLDAPDQNQAVGALQGQGYIVLAIQAEKARAAAARKGFGGGGRVSTRDLVFLADQLSTLLEGGVPLIRALSMLGLHTKNPALAEIVLQVSREVAAGATLAKAFEKYSKVFPPIWVALINSGEATGKLPQALQQVGAYLASADKLRRKVITALTYPTLLSIFSFGVLGFFIFKIIPVFAQIYSAFGKKLPAVTLLVLNFSAFMVDQSLTMTIGLIVLILACKGFVSTSQGKLTWSRMQLETPLLGEFLLSVYMERFLTCLATLIASGVNILDTLAILENIFKGNLLFQQAIQRARQEVAAGRAIGTAFKASKVFPPLVTDMILMGEESGKLPGILKTLSIFYQGQVDDYAERFAAVIDPILVISVGGIISFILVSVFFPIFQLAQIGGGG